jgi:hypothetical protein
MLFGRSIFESVVERLSAEDAEKPKDADDVVHYRVSGLNTGFVQETGQMQHAGADWARGQYLGLMDDEPWPLAPPEKPAHLSRLSDEEIAADLGLSRDDDMATLQAKRRAFAMTNHPDRVHANFIEAAHTRMTIANRMVDEALERRALRSL